MKTTNSNGNGYAAVQNGIVTTLDRIGDVALARPAAFLAERLEQQTAALSEKARFEATAALLNAAMSRYVALVFEPLADGTPAGVDPVTGFVRIKAPWASNSYKSWGLRRGEQAVLLAYLKYWQRRADYAAPIFLYSASSNRWSVNLNRYPDLRAALAVVQHGVLTAEGVAEIERSERAREARRRRKKQP